MYTNNHEIINGSVDYSFGGNQQFGRSHRSSSPARKGQQVHLDQHHSIHNEVGQCHDLDNETVELCYQASSLAQTTLSSLTTFFLN